jgi:hypothetical protein
VSAFEYLDADFEARRQAALRRRFQRRKKNGGFVFEGECTCSLMRMESPMSVLALQQ